MNLCVCPLRRSHTPTMITTVITATITTETTRKQSVEEQYGLYMGIAIVLVVALVAALVLMKAIRKASSTLSTGTEFLHQLRNLASCRCANCEKWAIAAGCSQSLKNIKITSSTGKRASVATNVYVLFLDAFLYSSSHFGPQYFSLMLTGAPQTVQ